MTIELAISLLAVPVFLAFAEWRNALLLCLATAVVQDPLRKLTPDQPVLFVVFVGVVFCAACFGASARGNPLTSNDILRRYPQFAMPFWLLMLIIILEAFNSYVRFGNIFISGIGLLAYVLAFPSIVFAYRLVIREGEFSINQFMKWYIVIIVLSLTTVYLEFAGYNWPILGQVGPKFIIYDETTGALLPSASGLFRASEVAAWHAMTSACFVMLMLLLRRITLTRSLIAVVVVTALVAIGILTGRRKIIIEVVVFASTYFVLWVVLEMGVHKIVAVVIAGAALAVCTFLLAQLREGVPQRGSSAALSYASYLLRGQSVFQEVPARFVELGIGPVMWAYDRFGLFGAGLGVGSQGTQYFGAVGQGAAEGGLGKIVLELGIPGLVVMGWLAISLLRQLWRIMRAASRHSPRIARLSFGLFSFIVANAAGFSVATQVYGDLFVLLILSWTLGFLLAVPVLIEREMRARQLPVFEEAASVFRPKTA